MQTWKRVLLSAAIAVAAVGAIVGLVIIYLVWAYNTPVTDTLLRVMGSTQRVLTVVDSGLTRADDGLSRAHEAVVTLDDTTRQMGETIVETNLAFAILERTVGDTLFPRVLAAQETVRSLAATIVAVNDTLEAANNLPFVNVPTLTDELTSVNDRLESVRTRVDELRAGLREIKEQKVARPVSLVTDRTTPLISDLENILALIESAQTRIGLVLARLDTLMPRVAGILDWISFIVTLVMLWLIGVQLYALIRAYERLRGRRVEWEKLQARFAARGSREGPASSDQ